MARLSGLTVNDTGFLKLPTGTDNQKNLQVFNSPGSYTWVAPAGVTSIAVLVVAGGGGGGNDFGAGGGGGGVVYHPTYAVTPGNSYTVTVGNGGAKSTNNANTASTGGNSVFDSLTANGGGGGASNSSGAAGNGGSGGGAAKINRTSYGTSNQSAFSGATVYGNRGGNASNDSGNGGGAGGGGAGAVGGDAPNASLNAGSVGGAGGVGIQITIGGISNFYGGGGGGGTYIGYLPGAGGNGGGGNGSCRDTRAQDGQPGTGGGGGGAGQAQIAGAGNGGSGIVIISANNKDNSANPAGITRFNSNKGIGGQIENYDPQAREWRSVKSRDTENVVTRGLVLHLDAGDPLSYSNQDKSTWYDLSGRGNHATLSGSIAYDSVAGGCIQFTGSLGQAQVPSTQDFAFGTQDFTWEAWVYCQNTSYSAYTHVMAFPDQNTNCLKINSNNNEIYFYSPGFTTYASTNGWNAANTYWNHIVLTRVQGQAYCYINGLYIGQKAGFTNNFTAQICNIGNGTGSENVAKKIGAVRVYKRALNPQEIQQNFNAHSQRFNLEQFQLGIVTQNLITMYDFGNPTSYCGATNFVNDISPVYNPVRNPSYWSNTGLSIFNGTLLNSPTYNGASNGIDYGGMLVNGHAIRINTIQPSDYVTVTIWYRFNGYNSSQSQLVNKENTYEFAHFNDGNFNFAVWTSNTSWFWQNIGFSSTAGTIYHFTFTWDGNNVRTYMDGRLIQNYAYSGNSTLANQTGYYTKFGERGGGSGWDNQYPANNTYYMIQIYDRALSDAEVTQNYEATQHRFPVRR